MFTDLRKLGVTKQVDGRSVTKLPEVEFHSQSGTGKIVDEQECFSHILSDIRQNPLISRVEESHRPAPKGWVLFAYGNQPTEPAQQGSFRTELGFHVYRLVAVHRVANHRQIQTRRVSLREAGVPIIT